MNKFENPPPLVNKKCNFESKIITYWILKKCKIEIISIKKLSSSDLNNLPTNIKYNLCNPSLILHQIFKSKCSKLGQDYTNFSHTNLTFYIL